MPIRIVRTQHVSVPRPHGEDARRRAVAFYSGLLGLREIPRPATFGDLDVTWFRIGDTELHVFGTEGHAHPGSHFCLQVDDLRTARRDLEAAGVPCRETDRIPNRPRFMIADPFGNSIEVTEIVGDYLEDTRS